MQIPGDLTGRYNAGFELDDALRDCLEYDGRSMDVFPDVLAAGLEALGEDRETTAILPVIVTFAGSLTVSNETCPLVARREILDDGRNNQPVRRFSVNVLAPPRWHRAEGVPPRLLSGRAINKLVSHGLQHAVDMLNPPQTQLDTQRRYEQEKTRRKNDADRRLQEIAQQAPPVNELERYYLLSQSRAMSEDLRHNGPIEKRARRAEQRLRYLSMRYVDVYGRLT